MKLRQKILLPSPSNEYENQLNRILYHEIDDITKQVNDLTEGRIFADHSAVTAKPTTGTFYKGDILRNSAPAEAGAGGSKYVVIGWICTVSGTPGTWVEMRVLTGN